MKKKLNIILLALSLSLTWSCGYRLVGSGASIIPDDAQTIFLPLFDNNSSSAEAAGFVTESLRDGLVRRSGLDLVADIAAADLTMEGTINTFQVTPVDLLAGGGTARYSVSVSVDVRLIDNRDNRLLYERKGLNYKDSYQTDQGNFFAMENDTLKRIAKEMASGLLSLIFDEF